MLRRLLLPFAALFLCQCGRPASEAECQEIVTRITELELKAEREVTATEVAREVSSVKEALTDRIQKECVGQPITDKAMACLRNAQSSKEAAECFH